MQCFVQRRPNDRWWTIVTGRAPMMYRKHLTQRGSHVELCSREGLATGLHRVALPRLTSTSCPCGIRLLECTVDEETRTRSLAGWWAMRLDPCPLLEQSSDVCAVTSSYCFTCTSCYWLHSTGDLRQQVILSLEFRLKITARE